MSIKEEAINLGSQIDIPSFGSGHGKTPMDWNGPFVTMVRLDENPHIGLNIENVNPPTMMGDGSMCGEGAGHTVEVFIPVPEVVFAFMTADYELEPVSLRYLIQQMLESANNVLVVVGQWKNGKDDDSDSWIAKNVSPPEIPSEWLKFDDWTASPTIFP